RTEPLLDRVDQRTGPGFLLRSLWLRRSGRFGARRWRRRFGNCGLWFRWFRWYSGFWGFRRFLSLLVFLLFVCHFLILGRNWKSEARPSHKDVDSTTSLEQVSTPTRPLVSARN